MYFQEEYKSKKSSNC